MSRIYIFTILLSSVLLSSCASMNKDECKLANWELIGYEDGGNGQTQAQIGKHRTACAKHGVAPDLSAYQKGHARGVRAFCNPNRGFALGSNGAHYRGMCPKDLEPAFLNAYRAGKRVHVARQQVRALNNKLNTNKTELKTAKAQLKNKEGLLISPQGNIAQKANLLLEIKDLNQQTGKLEAQIRHNEKDLAVARTKLNVISSSVRY